MRPFVSVVCPTYERRIFLPHLIKMFHGQTYPQALMELIILDDSSNSNQDIVDSLDINKNIKYVHMTEHVALGKKRNMINNMATGEYIVCFDDDDYYPPERVSHAVMKMSQSKEHLSGTDILYIYYTHLDKIYQLGPYPSINYASNGTLAYSKEYLKTHSHDDTSLYKEEEKFMNDFKEPLAKLDSFKTILCISHDKNTFDKKPIIKYGKETNLKLKSFVKDKSLIDFYKSLKT